MVAEGELKWVRFADSFCEIVCLPASDGGCASAKAIPFCLEMVRLSGEESNQILAELADWEQLLTDTSLARPPKPPAP